MIVDISTAEPVINLMGPFSCGVTILPIDVENIKRYKNRRIVPNTTFWKIKELATNTAMKSTEKMLELILVLSICMYQLF